MDYIVPKRSCKEKGGLYVLYVGQFYYFGMTKDFKKRMLQHVGAMRRGQHHNPKLQAAYNKYGEDSVRFVCAHPCSCRQAADLEAKFVQHAAAYRECANLRTSDGRVTFGQSESSRRKIGAAHRGKVLSEETRKKVSDGVRRAWSDPSLKKIIAESNSRRVWSDDARRRVSELKKNRKRTASEIAKTRSSLQKPVLVITSENKALYFVSGKAADAFLGLGKCKISQFLSGSRKPPKRLAGYRFFRLDKSRENWSIFPTECLHEHVGKQISGQ